MNSLASPRNPSYSEEIGKAQRGKATGEGHTALLCSRNSAPTLLFALRMGWAPKCTHPELNWPPREMPTSAICLPRGPHLTLSLIFRRKTRKSRQLWFLRPSPFGAADTAWCWWVIRGRGMVETLPSSCPSAWASLLQEGLPDLGPDLPSSSLSHCWVQRGASTEPDSLRAHSSPCGPDTAVSAVAASAAMTTTAPGWRTAWGSATTPSSWPTWHCSWPCFCGACTWHGGFLHHLGCGGTVGRSGRDVWRAGAPSVGASGPLSKGLPPWAPWGAPALPQP